MDYRRLKTVAQVVEETPWLTESMLRMWIERADRYGFNEVIVRPTPGRILIDPEALNRFVEERRQR